LIAEVYIEMNKKGPIYRKILGYYAVIICMLVSSHSNFYYARYIYNTRDIFVALYFGGNHDLGCDMP